MSHENVDDISSSPPNGGRLLTKELIEERAEGLNALSTEEQNLLKYEINSAILHFLNRDTSVYLEGFGLLFPALRGEERSEVRDQIVSVWHETTRTVGFEKANHLLSMHRERFVEVAETKDIVRWFYKRLPVFMSGRFTERDMRKIVRQWVTAVQKKVVEQGHCDELSAVGTLFSLHNRQGSRIDEWFGGADIFIEPEFKRVVHSGERLRFLRPTLSSSWELLTAKYGAPLWKEEIRIKNSLASLGYEANAIPESSMPRFSVAAFRVPSGGDRLDTLICSNGLRALTKSAEKVGSELIVIIRGDADMLNLSLPEFVEGIFAAGWLLLQSSPSRSLKEGARLSVGNPLFPDPAIPLRRNDLTGVIVTPLESSTTPHQCEDGAFQFQVLVGITEEENTFASHRSPTELLTLLRHRRLHQVTSPSRNSIFHRSHFSR